MHSCSFAVLHGVKNTCRESCVAIWKGEPASCRGEHCTTNGCRSFHYRHSPLKCKDDVVFDNRYMFQSGFIPNPHNLMPYHTLK